MLAVSEQVSQEIQQSLKSMGLAALSSDSTAFLMGQLQDIAHAQNCVRSVVGERPGWGGHEAEGDSPGKLATEPPASKRHDPWAGHGSGFSSSKCRVGKYIFFSLKTHSGSEDDLHQEFMTFRCGTRQPPC